MESWRQGTSAGHPCVYCGVPAATIDHVPPQSIRPFIAEKNLKGLYPFQEVHACHECNTLLGARPLWTVPVRKKFIKRALRIRHRKTLQAPSWKEDELAELGESLRHAVEVKQMQKELLLRRLSY